jgi:transketolase
LGPSHQATEDIAAMRVLPEISVYSPSDDRLAEMLVPHCIKEPGPKYLRLDRTGTPLVYKDELPDLASGFQELIAGRDVCIVSTGRMVFQAMAVAEALKQHSIEAGVMDLFRIKPFPEEALCRALSKSRLLATLEDHFVTGGVGTALLEALSNQGLQKPVLRLGIPGRFCRVYGDRQYLLKENHLDVETLVEKLVSFVRKD